MLNIVCLLALVAAAAASDVLVYTDSDFADNIVDHPLALVEFYAPWCGHCKRLEPEYEKAATALQKSDTPVALIKVDCTANTVVCGKYGVSGYPTLKIFRGGEQTEDYNGPREADGIVKTLRSKAGPSSKDLKSVAEAEKFLDSMEPSIVGFFETEGSALQKEFSKLADGLSEDYRFAYTTDPAVMEKYAQKNVVVIFQARQMHNKFEESEKKYEGSASLSEMKKWLLDNVFGLAGHRTSGNQGQFQDPLVVAYYDVDYHKNAKGTNYWRNRVMKVAKDHTDLNFAVSNSNELSSELQEFGLNAGGDKPLVALKDSKGQKFVMQEEFSVAALQDFIAHFKAGKLKPYLKSEPVPEDNDGPVKVVVAENFDALVNDPSKDVLIEFYAPWCGHCKSLAPKYEELGEKLAGESDIVIAKMDATANDVPKAYQVSGFPTLYFAPKNSKDAPKKYNGGREVDDFMKYLAKESTDELKGFSRSGKAKKSEL